MADKKVRIIVTGKDDASKAMKSVNRSLLSVVKGAAAVAIAFKVMHKASQVVTEMVEKSTKLAARNKMMATSLHVVGKTAGWAGGQLERAVAAVKKMGITTGVATTTVTRYIQSQLDAGKTTGEATARIVELASAARDLAVVAGTNTSEALQTMQRAISGVLPRSLRVFGITESLISVFDRYGATLKKVGEDLTELERKQAIEWRILEEGVRVAGAYDAAMGSVGKQMASLARISEDAQAVLGEAFLPGMQTGVTIATDFWKAIEVVAPEIRDQLAPALATFGEEVMPLVQAALGKMVEILPKVTNEIANLLILLGKGTQAAWDHRDATAKSADAYEEYMKAMMRSQGAQGLLQAGVSRLNLEEEMLRLGIAMTVEEWAAHRAEIAANESELQRLANMTTVVGPAMTAMAQTVGEAWQTAFDSDAVQKAVGKMRDIISDHQADLVDMQYEFGARREKAEFDFSVRQLIARAKFNAEMAQLQAAGDEEGMAKLQAKFDESQTLTEWDNEVQKQLAERGELEALVIQKRKNLAELQTQHAAIKASITAETIAALSRHEIQRTAASKMLGILGVSLTAALNTEKAFVTQSSDVFRKWGTNIVQTAATGVNAVRALMDAWAGDIAGAEAALADAQAALEGFALDLPPLALPDLPSELGGAAAAVTEAAQTIIADMTEDMADAIGDAKQMIEDLVGFELPEGWELGLDKYKTAMLAVSKKFAEIWREAQEQLEDAAEAAPGLKAIASAFGALVDATNKMKDFSEEAFEDAGGFEAATLGYIDRYEFVSVAMLDWIRRMTPRHREILAEAAPVAANIKKLFSLLGPDLTKIVPVRSAAKFRTDTVLYFSQMRDVGKLIMKWIGEIKPAWRVALADATPVAENIRKLFSILGIKLEEIKDPGAGWVAAFTTFLERIEEATDIAVVILNRIKAKWGDQLATAAETMKHAADIWKGVADMTRAIDEAAELGGPDIAAANAMAGMTSDIFMGRPGQIGGAAGGLPGLGGDTIINLHITAEMPDGSILESGEISTRVAANEGQLIDMRISMASASV